MPGKNVYWFAGDRFSCVDQKTKVLDDLGAKWVIRDVTKSKANQICAIINSNPLFGETHIAMVCDGKLPEPKKICDALLNLPDDRAFILLEPKVDKRSVTYKKLKDKIQEFDAAVSKEGFVDRSKIKIVGEQIKKRRWNGSDEVFDHVFESCGYDVGKTISEIKKIGIYLNGEKASKIEDVDKILCMSHIPDVDDLIRSIFLSDIYGSFKVLTKIINSVDLSSYAFSFFNSILDRLLIIAYARICKDEGLESDRAISKIVALRLEKDGKSVNQYYIMHRMSDFEDVIDTTSSEKVLNAIKWAREGIDGVFNEIGTPKFLMRRFVYNSV